LIRLLEQKMQELESGHHEELVTFQEERSSLQQLVARQSSVITELQTHLDQATGNNTILLSQQQQLTETVNSLLKLCSKDRGSGGTGWILGPMFPVTESINEILWGMNIIA
jgi:small-conductance mechanosensitive channel